MKRFAFSALIFAVASMAAIGAARANTVIIQNETSLCYGVHVQLFPSDGPPITIGRLQIDSKKRHLFTYKAPVKGAYSLFVGADPCYHGPIPGSTHAKDPRAEEIFNIVQPGQSVYIVRKP